MGQFGLGLDDGKLMVFFNGIVVFMVGMVLNLNVWLYVVMSWDGLILCLYVDSWVVVELVLLILFLIGFFDLVVG